MVEQAGRQVDRCRTASSMRDTQVQLLCARHRQPCAGCSRQLCNLLAELLILLLHVAAAGSPGSRAADFVG